MDWPCGKYRRQIWLKKPPKHFGQTDGFFCKIKDVQLKDRIFEQQRLKIYKWYWYYGTTALRASTSMCWLYFRTSMALRHDKKKVHVSWPITFRLNNTTLDQQFPSFDWWIWTLLFQPLTLFPTILPNNTPSGWKFIYKPAWPFPLHCYLLNVIINNIKYQTSFYCIICK